MKPAWFNEYREQLEAWGFQLDLANTCGGLSVVCFRSSRTPVSVVKHYFAALGFVNTDKRTYMAHTGNPHVNLDKGKNTVQISWYPKGGPVGIDFLGGI